MKGRRREDGGGMEEMTEWWFWTQFWAGDNLGQCDGVKIEEGWREDGRRMEGGWRDVWREIWDIRGRVEGRWKEDERMQ